MNTSLHRHTFNLPKSLLFIVKIVKAFARKIMNDDAIIQFANGNHAPLALYPDHFEA
ncbi:MAG: hypothetical protein ACJAYF_002399 [Arenicella sp.]|jgi:hypothetical protein